MSFFENLKKSKKKRDEEKNIRLSKKVAKLIIDHQHDTMDRLGYGASEISVIGRKEHNSFTVEVRGILIEDRKQTHSFNEYTTVEKRIPVYNDAWSDPSYEEAFRQFRKRIAESNMAYSVDKDGMITFEWGTRFNHLFA